jgi:hypothetical protein
MRLLVAVGALSVAGSLLVACGDDDDSNRSNGGTGGLAGSAGSAGRGGSGGNAGTAGGTAGTAGSTSAGAGGTAGTAGSAGTAGTGGTQGSNDDPDAGDGGLADADVGDAGSFPCTGCLELRAPCTAINQSAFFQMSGPGQDLSDTIVTFRVRALFLDETDQLLLNTFATDGENDTFVLGVDVSVPVNSDTFSNDDFIDLDLDVGAIAEAGFDPTDVIAIGLQLFAGGTFAVPNTGVILLDSITAVGGGDGDAGSEITVFDFDDNAEGFALNVNAGIQTATVTHH